MPEYHRTTLSNGLELVVAPLIISTVSKLSAM